jgi:hypothetical protein
MRSFSRRAFRRVCHRRREGAGPLQGREVRPRAGRHRHEADGRHHAAQAAQALRPELRRHHHDGLRQHRERDPGAEVRRLRLPAEAVPRRRAHRHAQARDRVRQFQAERAAARPACRRPRPSDIEAASSARAPRLKKLIQQVKKLAGVRTPVLLQGENGTGKATVAEVLHATQSPEGAVVRIDCSLSSEANFREGLLGAERRGRRVGPAGQGRHAVPPAHPVPLPARAEGTGQRAAQHRARLPPDLHDERGSRENSPTRAVPRRAVLPRGLAAGAPAAPARSHRGHPGCS